MLTTTTTTTVSVNFGPYIVILIAGAICYLVGMFLKRQYISKNEACSYMTEGQIIDLDIKKTVDKNGSTSSTYYPVYSYNYGGKEYRIISDQSAKDAWEYKKGQAVTVMLEPERPENSYLKEQEGSLAKAYKIFIGLGIALFIMSALAYIFKFFH